MTQIFSEGQEYKTGYSLEDLATAKLSGISTFISAVNISTHEKVEVLLQNIDTSIEETKIKRANSLKLNK